MLFFHTAGRYAFDEVFLQAAIDDDQGQHAQNGGGGANAKMMNFGKSRARMSTDEDKKITFKNVAGLDEEKEDLVEIVDFLKNQMLGNTYDVEIEEKIKTMQTATGEEVSSYEIKTILQQCIDEEDKRHPLTDETLMNILNEKGYCIARRTVAKYREMLGIPVARLRKQI